MTPPVTASAPEMLTSSPPATVTAGNADVNGDVVANVNDDVTGDLGGDEIGNAEHLGNGDLDNDQVQEEEVRPVRQLQEGQLWLLHPLSGYAKVWRKRQDETIMQASQVLGYGNSSFGILFVFSFIHGSQFIISSRGCCSSQQKKESLGFLLIQSRLSRTQQG